jgi:uncharacterized membrane-anchored protein
LLSALAMPPALAQQTPTPADPTKELQAAVDAALSSLQAGPADVRLRDQAVLHLPAGYAYVAPAEAQRLLRAMGNRPGDDLADLVIDSAKPFGGWFAVIRHIASGFVKDDDAKDWNADDLLGSLRWWSTPLSSAGAMPPALTPCCSAMRWATTSRPAAPAWRSVCRPSSRSSGRGSR